MSGGPLSAQEETSDRLIGGLRVVVMRTLMRLIGLQGIEECRLHKPDKGAAQGSRQWDEAALTQRVGEFIETRTLQQPFV